MSEFFVKPGARGCYVSQPGPFLCWAAAGLALYRSKHGPGGRGASIRALMEGGDNPWFGTCVDFAGALVERARREGIDLDSADELLREENPRFADAVPGLKFEHADEFFARFLGARATPLGAGPGALDPKDRRATMDFIAARAPVAVFHRTSAKVGHLQLIVGYWNYSDSDPDSPRIVMFDPEAGADGTAGVDPRDIAATGERQMSWTHFQSFIVDKLVTRTFYAF